MAAGIPRSYRAAKLGNSGHFTNLIRKLLYHLSLRQY